MKIKNIMINEFIQGIKNIIYWFPIIWKDRDYDHAYIEYMMEHKFKAMYKRFNDPNATYVNWETDHAAKALKALKICLIILERRREEFYITNLYNIHFDADQVKDVIDIEDRDWRILNRLIEKYMLYWWD